MKLVVGLGNPGFRYRHTRHNVGFLAVDAFSRKKSAGSRGKAVLLKPQLYMNNSGIAVKKTIYRLGVPLKNTLVICDDVNLKLGTIRLRSGGSAGGHKGLQSIIDELGTEEFSRLRIGIGTDEGSVLTDYVLSGFMVGERKILKNVLERAAEAVRVWIDRGIDAAMNEFNKKTANRGGD